MQPSPSSLSSASSLIVGHASAHGKAFARLASRDYGRILLAGPDGDQWRQEKQIRDSQKEIINISFSSPSITSQIEE